MSVGLRERSVAIRMRESEMREVRESVIREMRESEKDKGGMPAEK